MSEKPPGKL